MPAAMKRTTGESLPDLENTMKTTFVLATALVGLVAACSAPGSEPTTGSAQGASTPTPPNLDPSDFCPAEECGPALGIASTTCADGSAAAPRCVQAPNSTCVWVPGQCAAPPPVVCAKNACGPQPGVLSKTCSDGSLSGPECGADANGKCAWTIRQCPSTGIACAPTPPCAADEIAVDTGTDGCLDACVKK